MKSFLCIIAGLFILSVYLSPIFCAEPIQQHQTINRLNDDPSNETTTTTTTTTTTPSTSTTTTDSTTTTTTTTTTTATTTITDSTTTSTATPTTTTTTSTLTTTTASQEPNTTTTTAPDTTTTNAPTTTTSAPPDAILNFTVSSNSSVCLKVVLSAKFNITYLASVDKVQSNSSALIALNDFTAYGGECAEEWNSLNVQFLKNWFLRLNYTLKNTQYQLSTLQLSYVVDKALFPNAVELGAKSAVVNNLGDFSSNKGNSYRCISETQVNLNPDVTLFLSNYQAQPFMEGNKNDFDTAVECPADITGTSKLVPIIVGSSLAVLVVLVLIAYVIGRRKHRPGYQQV